MEMVKNNNYVTIPIEEYESMKATIETLNDRKVINQIRKSKNSSSKSLSQFKKERNID